MGRKVLSRLAQAAVAFVAVTIVMFGITNVVGDPVNAIVPPGTTIEHRNRVRQELGFDRPLSVRFGEYMAGVVVGDLGESYVNKRDVTTLIAQRLPATLQLGGLAVLAAISIGIPLGLLAGKSRHSGFDRIIRFAAVLGQSAPAFWVGILLIAVFAVRLGWAPTGGREGTQSLILPVITLSWATVAGITRLMRSSVIEVLEADYVTFLRMQGASERRILWKHALRNSLLPVLTYGGLLAAGVIVGSVVTESVFAWPGMGKLLLDAVHSRDYPIVQGVTLVFAGSYILMALVVDLLYTVLNPKLREHRAS